MKPRPLANGGLHALSPSPTWFLSLFLLSLLPNPTSSTPPVLRKEAPATSPPAPLVDRLPLSGAGRLVGTMLDFIMMPTRK
ncbi:hypothetical protein E2562_010771 [Oryza meyeriana var. granulata]|uniref:Uncharacterized protein n=1 Tax=Oryza meyeriana var. granulata TaxID=110450 RepID=A0A6G1EWA8_9ORYZ|nr:hypothetical protein E2562_010771 [Oryza meyeriana var. granulata]